MFCNYCNFCRRLLLFTTVVLIQVIGCAQRNDGGRSDKAANELHAPNVADVWGSVIRITPGNDLGDRLAGTLSMQDTQAIAKKCPAVIAVAPVCRVRATIAFGKMEWTPWKIYGTTPEYLRVIGLENVRAGRAFTDIDVHDAASVCLIGPTAAEGLFQNVSPLGQEIQIRGRPLRVIGILNKRGRNAIGLDEDDVILVPWSIVGSFFPKRIPGDFNAIFARVASSEKLPMAISEVTQVLREQHHLMQSNPDDFTITNLDGR